MTGDAERRKRRKAAEAAAVSVEPTGATEAPEPPAAPDNSPEREVEPAVEPAAPDHPCLRHPDPEVRALAALQLKIEAEQSGTESKEEIELKVKMAWLAPRLADDYCVCVGDTERTKRGSSAGGGLGGERRGGTSGTPAAGRKTAFFGASTTKSEMVRPRWSSSGTGWPAAGKNPGFSWRISGPL